MIETDVVIMLMLVMVMGAIGIGAGVGRWATRLERRRTRKVIDKADLALDEGAKLVQQVLEKSVRREALLQAQSIQIQELETQLERLTRGMKVLAKERRERQEPSQN